MRYSPFEPGTAGLQRLDSLIDTFGKQEEVEQTTTYSPYIQQLSNLAQKMASKLGVKLLPSQPQ